MTPLERFILRWIFRRLINQGGWYGSHIKEIYKMVRYQAVTTFPEDNAATIDNFLEEQFLAAIKQSPS